MCGRYVLKTGIKAVEKKFNVVAAQPELYVPSPNVAIGEYAPVVASDAPGALQFFQFGFTPSWAKKRMYVINARSEGNHNKEDDPRYSGAMGILEKPMFRRAIRSQRCLVIADAFLEGSKTKRLSEPYVVYPQRGQAPFAMAGIWDEWVDTTTGDIHRSFAVITTVANALLQKIGHHRSPVILDRESEQTWISTDTPLSEVTSLLRAFDPAEFNAYRISSDIKSPRAKDFTLLKPIGERLNKDYDFEIYEDIALEGMGETRARQRRREEGG